MIEINRLSAGYPGKPVLQDITLTFQSGEVLVLSGPNGCGKSTLLRTALGLHPRTGGQILYDSVSIDRLSPRQIAKKASYVAQSRNVPGIIARRMVLHGRFPYLSYPRNYRPEDYEIAGQALKWVHAEDIADQPMASLSGGQRQKIYLAMALAQDTETILMDEPTTFLDVRHQLEVMAMARRLASQGKAVILVLHDLCMALRTADRIAVMADGCLRLTGDPEHVYASGILDETFGIRLGRFAAEDGWQYYYK